MSTLSLKMAFVWISSLAAFALGCEGKVTAGEGGGAGSTSGGGAAGSGGTTGNGGAGTGGDSGGTTGTGGFAGTGGFGSVGLARIGNIDLAFGQFLTNEGPGCAITQESISGCTLYTQSTSCAQVPHDAGTITIQSPTSTTTLTFGQPSVDSPTPLFAPGEILTMSGTGAEVPAFSGNVVAPGPVKVMSPSLAGPLTITMAQGLPLAWQATTGRVVVYISSVGPTEYRTLSCEFNGAAGVGTMPPAALSAHGPGSANFFVYSVVSATTMAGAWPVGLFVEIQGTDTQGFDAQVMATLE